MNKPLPKSLIDFISKTHPERFAEGWTEKDYSEGDHKPWSHWVYLKPGWANVAQDPAGGMHIIHESSVRECIYQFRRAAPCSCEDCRKAKEPAR